MTDKTVAENFPATIGYAGKIRSAIHDSRIWRLLGFYVGVPLAVTIYGSANNWSLLENLGYGGAFIFYAAHGFVPWWVTGTMTMLVMIALRRWKPPSYLLMLVGSTIGCFITLPYTNLMTSMAEERWGLDQAHAQIAPLFSAAFWEYTARATIIWLGVNFVFDRFLGLPRYRYVIPRGYDFRDRLQPVDEANAADTVDTGDQASALRPGFLDRAPIRLAMSDVLAIKAEQHYVRLYTPKRELMVLYRFSDVIRETDPGIGMQVHRSYWVNKSAIKALRPSAKKFSLRLTNGMDIPVSAPYQGIVKEYAREAGIQ